MPGTEESMNPEASILEAAKTGDAAKLAELLRENPKRANFRNEQGETPILAAQYRGHRQVVQLLLDSGVELSVYEAAAVGALDRVRARVEADPSLVNSFSPDGFTPLSLASFFGHLAVIEFLLQQGAEVNVGAKNPTTVMPLHAAAAGHHTAIAELLLAHGAQVNAQQQAGYTPLHSAANSGQEEMARLLLSQGADVAAKDDSGKTPRDIALAKNHTAVADLLK